jgi:hypothetical protein
MDFTLKTYKILMNTLSDQGFSFLTFEQFVSNPDNKVIVLRHDVDDSPQNSLEFAKIQADLGIKGSYYFRIVAESFDEKIIKEIYELGHEIGYHYEDVSLAAERQKIKVKRQKFKNKEFSDLQDRKLERSGDPASAGTARPQDNGRLEKELADIAIESFSKNLERLRGIAPVKTICMHGSPMSKWDSRLLWKYYNYRDFGIIGEPYFDLGFSEIFYLTDTGRRWDGENVAIRDKAQGSGLRAQGKNSFAYWKVKPVKYREESIRPSDEENEGQKSRVPRTTHRAPFPKFHSTFDIIKAALNNQLPDKIMMTFHPQRWTDKPVPWVKELVWQNVKNVVKYFVVKVNSR